MCAIFRTLPCSYRCPAVNLRTQFGRILESAGVLPWPKLFQNLRVSRRTELQEQYPSHAIDAWLGHSTKVAEAHYLIVTDDHWSRAVNSRSPTGSPIANGAGSITSNRKTKKTLKNKGIDGSQGLAMVGGIPPAGIEPAA
jgi:hypothetical protein